MTSPAVVILTDPAQCQPADADTLVKALLQLQQLNQAGAPASQAFCDHPAAAMQFIDAYRKAYPELQQQSSDLPLPEHLYSMVADGRLGPLHAPDSQEATKPGETGQLNPLYVLSLGTPETLVQALEHNSLVKSNIRVLEIAPIESSESDRVSIASAVAPEPVTRSSWLTEDESSSARGHEDALRAEPLTEDEAVLLGGVEVDLDRIQVEPARDRDRAVDQRLDDAAPAIVEDEPEAHTVATGRHAPDEAAASNASGADAASEPAGPLTPPPEPVPDSRAAPNESATRSTAPTVEPPGDPQPPDDPEPPSDPEPPDEVGASPPQEPVPSDDGPAAGPGPSTGTGEDLKGEPDLADDALAGPIASADVREDAFANRSWSFTLPGEDVEYLPASGLEHEDDLAYPIPEGHGASGILGSFLDLAEHVEVVDLEAMYGSLAASASAPDASADRDLVLMHSARPEPSDAKDSPTSDSNGRSSPARYHDDREADLEEADNAALSTSHDLDV